MSANVIPADVGGVVIRMLPPGERRRFRATCRTVRRWQAAPCVPKDPLVPVRPGPAARVLVGSLPTDARTYASGEAVVDPAHWWGASCRTVVLKDDMSCPGLALVYDAVIGAVTSAFVGCRLVVAPHSWTTRLRSGLPEHITLVARRAVRLSAVPDRPPVGVQFERLAIDHQTRQWAAEARGYVAPWGLLTLTHPTAVDAAHTDRDDDGVPPWPRLLLVDVAANGQARLVRTTGLPGNSAADDEAGPRAVLCHELEVYTSCGPTPAAMARSVSAWSGLRTLTVHGMGASDTGLAAALLFGVPTITRLRLSWTDAPGTARVLVAARFPAASHPRRPLFVTFLGPAEQFFEHVLSAPDGDGNGSRLLVVTKATLLVCGSWDGALDRLVGAYRRRCSTAGHLRALHLRAADAAPPEAMREPVHRAFAALPGLRWVCGCSGTDLRYWVR